LGKYPASFFLSYIHLRETPYTVDSMNNIYYVHSSYDSIYKMNIRGVIMQKNQIHECPKRKEYKEKDLTNLTYLRNYLATTENNVSILNINNAYIVVLKKLAQANVLDKPTYKYFVFTMDLEKKYSDTIRHQIFPKLYNCKNGFFVIAENLDRIIEYEIH
jgi:S-adenosylmethionine:diacylglycerol 3-amino-3-carboxypropyl transferase